MWKRDESVTPREGRRDLAAEAAAVVSRTAEKVIGGQPLSLPGPRRRVRSATTRTPRNRRDDVEKGQGEKTSHRRARV